ncbi:hypothetical protein AGIG_G20275 [Arapaima gigas]
MHPERCVAPGLLGEQGGPTATLSWGSALLNRGGENLLFHGRVSEKISRPDPEGKQGLRIPEICVTKRQNRPQRGDADTHVYDTVESERDSVTSAAFPTSVRSGHRGSSTLYATCCPCGRVDFTESQRKRISNSALRFQP